MNKKRWTEEEDRFLLDNYESLSFDEIEKHLERTHNAILLRAIKLGVRRNGIDQRQGDINSLLLEKPDSYYWIGFIMADGTVLNNKRIRVSLSCKDEDHLKKMLSL